MPNDEDDDLGAPELPPGTRMHTFNGNSPEPVSSPLLDAQMAAKKIAAQQARGAPINLPGAVAAEEASINPRLECLRLAAKSGATDPRDVMRIAREYLEFVQGV